jgi:hypothetical protein
MSEDERYIEILATLNRLEVNWTKTAQRFEDYKESRVELPKNIQEIQKAIATCQQACNYKSEISSEYRKKVDFLMLWSGRAMALLFAIGIINMILIALGRLIDIEYTMK